MKKNKYKEFSSKARFIFLKKFLAKLKGARDYKNHQVIYRGEFWTTPGIEQNTAILVGRINDITKDLIQELSAMYEDVYYLYETVKQINNGENELNNEKRTSADISCEARRSTNDKKKKEKIILKMARYKEKIHIFDEQYKHELEQIYAIENAKLAAYWAGILKAAKNSELGEHRRIEPVHNPGLDLYEFHKERILMLINEVLESEGGDRDVLA